MPKGKPRKPKISYSCYKCSSVDIKITEVAGNKRGTCGQCKTHAALRKFEGIQGTAPRPDDVNPVAYLAGGGFRKTPIRYDD
jgi:hypothetical protein